MSFTNGTKDQRVTTSINTKVPTKAKRKRERERETERKTRTEGGKRRHMERERERAIERERAETAVRSLCCSGSRSSVGFEADQHLEEKGGSAGDSVKDLSS